VLVRVCLRVLKGAVDTRHACAFIVIQGRIDSRWWRIVSVLFALPRITVRVCVRAGIFRDIPVI
jgi:hypothetical protein